MDDETLVRLLSDKIAYQAAFSAAVLTLKDVVTLVTPSPESQAAAKRIRDVMSLVRGEFLSLQAGFRDDLENGTNRQLRAKLAELLAQIEPLLVALDVGGADESGSSSQATV